MRVTDTSDLWWKSAVVYCLDIETFYDANGDGIGDLAGLAERIDYLAELGITCLWLMPFYPSPDRDDGYDIKDFYGVDPRLGNHGELVEVIRTAHDRGIKVIADLVINHTSDQHPWFKESRKSADREANPYRDYYIWRDTEPPDTSAQVVFPDKEDSIWENDPKTGEWYLHHFYRHQPDLNLANPRVMDEVLRSIGFWLELGFDGFRVDGIPFLEQNRKNVGDPDFLVDPHDLMRQIRGFLNRRTGRDDARRGQPAARATTAVLRRQGGQRDAVAVRLHRDAGDLPRAGARPGGPDRQGAAQPPEIDQSCQWGNFLRNHDELTLDKLTEAQRQEVFDAFGPEPDMQVYDRGLKRRLPPMLGGDPRRVRMAYSLMFALPGTPTLYYGEEIGMGEDLAAEGRMAVRTPMQWSNEANAGFSTALKRRLVQRVVPDGYGRARQRHRPAPRPRVAVALHPPTHRRTPTCPEIGWGTCTVIDQPHAQVLAHRCDIDGSAVVAVHNLAAEPVTVTIPVGEGDGDGPAVVDLFSDDVVEQDVMSVRLPLEGHGFRWLRVRPTGDLAIP